MGYATPDYGLLKNLPQPDPVGSALGAYKTVQDTMLAKHASARADQTAAMQQRLGGLQAQKAQIALNNQQKDEALNQHKTALDNQVAQLTIHNAKRTVHDTRLADIHTAADDQKEGTYQKYLTEMTSLGADTSKLPRHYDKSVADEANTAYQKSPQGVGDTKFARDTAMQKLKDMDAMQIAMAKQRATPGPGQAQLDKSEAIANSKYKDTVINDAGSARNILGDTDNITAALSQAAAGYSGSLTNYNSEAGQELKKNTSQLVLDKLQGMKNVSRGTNLLMTIIKRSKPSDWMKRESIQRIVAGLAAISHRAVEKEKFTQYMWDHGIKDRGKIDTIWSNYDEKYSLINVKTNTVNTQNVGRWAEYLAQKQQAKKGK